MKNRRDFLKTACKPIVIAALGIPLLEACAAEEISSDNSSDYISDDSGRAPLTIDLTNNSFSNLQEVGGWMNYISESLLLVRISEEEIRVFDNRCPHQGNRDRWVYDGSEFTCQHHNNSFSDTCGGSLKCYTASLNGNALTVSFD